MSEQPLTVLEALAGVMGEVQSIGKDDRNKQQDYAFRGIDAVVNAVGPALRNHGVIVVPTSVHHESEHYVTKSGAHMKGVALIVGFRFYGPDGSYIDAVASGEAADAGDKATPKAHSVAFRTLLLQALCIPTGEPDPDAESHQRGAPAERRQEGPPPTPVPKGWAEIESYVRSADNSDEAWALFSAFVRAASYHLFGKADSSELEQAERDTLYQKAAGASLWLVDKAPTEGPFRYFDEDVQRRAWASVLDGGPALAIPDYEPPASEPTTEERELAEQALDEQAREAALEPSVPQD